MYISFYFKKRRTTNSKLQTILEDKSQTKIKFTELDGGVLATTHIPNIKEFGKDKTIARIETDYFGGSGHQSAKLFVNNKRVYNESDEFSFGVNPINDVLKLMNVECKPGMDGFDTIGLGKYRSNSDFI